MTGKVWFILLALALVGSSVWMIPEVAFWRERPGFKIIELSGEDYTIPEFQKWIAGISFSESGDYEVLHDLHAPPPALDRNERVFLYRAFFRVLSGKKVVVQKPVFPSSTPLVFRIYFSVESQHTPFTLEIIPAENANANPLRVKKFQVFKLR